MTRIHIPSCQRTPSFQRKSHYSRGTFRSSGARVLWTILSTAVQLILETNISLPLTCSIKSDLINWGSINIKSAKTKTITLKDNRMKIWKREHIEERRATLTKDDFLINPLTSKNLTIRNVWSHPLGGITIYQWIIIAIAAIAILALGFWYYCRGPKIPRTTKQQEKSTNIEMKNYFGSETPTYLHPEAQHKTPDAPPRPTTDKGTSPNIKRK